MIGQPLMLTGIYILIIAYVMFLLLIYSMHVEDNRGSNRRRQDLFFLAERRRLQRRKGRSTRAFVKWAAKALWS